MFGKIKINDLRLRRKKNKGKNIRKMEKIKEVVYRKKSCQRNLLFSFIRANYFQLERTKPT